MVEKCFHFFGPHFLRMPDAMKTDALNPMDVDRLGARTVGVRAHGAPGPVERFGDGRDGVWQLVAFLAELPSRRQEIYDKLTYNSR
jgi:hypothetical protein